jgi:hypothetical protein
MFRFQEPMDVVLLKSVDTRVVERSAAVAAARYAPFLGAEPAGADEVPKALRTLIGCYYNDPANVELCARIDEARRGMRVNWPQLAARPEVVVLLEKLDTLIPPLVAPVRGAPLSQIAAVRLARARDWLNRGEASLAIEEVLEAINLVPDLLGEAEPLLEQLVNAGALTRAILHADPRYEHWLSHPRFDAWLTPGEGAASAPSP